MDTEALEQHNQPAAAALRAKAERVSQPHCLAGHRVGCRPKRRAVRAGPCRALVKTEALEQHVSQWLLDLKTKAEGA